MTPNSGDVVLCWHVKPNLFNRLTSLATKTVEIPDPPHHVQVMRSLDFHFSNQPPHAVCIPDLRMRIDADAGIVDYATYRWHEWVGETPDYPVYREYRAGIRAAIYIANDIHIPYDFLGPFSLGMAALRKRFPALGKVDKFRNAMHKYFCSEGVEKYQLAAGLDMFAEMADQPEHDGIPYRAPVHFARLVLDGKLVLVEDHGGHKRLIPNERAGAQ